MNFNYYIYGTPGGHYSQWPDDYTSALFGQQARSVHGLQALIHRKESLFFYALTERLDDGNAIGLAVVLNNAQTQHPLSLFALMRKFLNETIPIRGKLLQYNTSGQLRFSIGHISEASEECQWIGEQLERRLDNLGLDIPFSSPDVAYDGRDSRTVVDMDTATDKSVLNLAKKYNTIELTSSTDSAQTYVSRLIAQMNERIGELERDNAEKEDKLKKTIKKKKQYSLVVVLLLILFLGGAVSAYIIRGNFFTIGSLNKNLEQKQDTIQRHQEYISELQDSVGRQMTIIKNLSEKIGKMENVLSRYASLRYTVGMPTINNNAFDEGYALWFYAEVPIIIESIALRAKKIGYVSIVLRDAEGNWVASETVSVNTFFSQKTVDLKVPSSGYYSLSIESDGVRLQYNSVNSETYQIMGSGPLRIKGCCEKGQGYTSARQSYYQYFYNIKYRVDL